MERKEVRKRKKERKKERKKKREREREKRGCEVSWGGNPGEAKVTKRMNESEIGPE